MYIVRSDVSKASASASFSIRNHYFYEKLGFVKVNEVENPEAGWSDFYYEMIVSQ